MSDRRGCFLAAGSCSVRPAFHRRSDRNSRCIDSGITPDAAAWREGFQQGLLDAFLTGPPQHAGPVPLDAEQQAVEDALMTAAGSRPQGHISQLSVNGKPTPGTLAAVSAAARRFATLPASARHAWLAAHLAALRAGTITLAQLP